MTFDADAASTPDSNASRTDTGSSAPAGRSPRTIGLIVVGVTVFLIAGATTLVVHAAANARFDAAVADQAESTAVAAAAYSQLDAAVAEATSTGALAADLLDTTAGFVDTTAQGDLGVAAAELTAAIDAGEELDRESAAAPEGHDRPVWFADLDRATEGLEADTERLAAAAIGAREHVEVVQDAVVHTQTSGTNFIAMVPPIATSIDAATGSARNLDRIELRLAMEDLEGAGWGSDAPARIDAYVAAASAAQASHGAEEAEKAGPLYERRKQVEEFARSIAGGVLLEFDWAPTVNGYGTGGSYGGTSTWDTSDGGLSTITLSNSVAEMWGDPGVVALVVHEVGHSITSKCYDLMGDGLASNNEVWATAWAIGMGYTHESNGVNNYGQPSPEAIALSQSCR
ncbi:hypothetical protein [Agromyces laixinhei]|uniref:hypothetical protein n=1 Tax=Agromyces laixinhei TaxID=2585717 RepID=UPI0012EDF494|nr:hypothetical protein [Agromyces laixinhei]